MVEYQLKNGKTGCHPEAMSWMRNQPMYNIKTIQVGVNTLADYRNLIKGSFSVHHQWYEDDSPVLVVFVRLTEPCIRGFLKMVQKFNDTKCSIIYESHTVKH